MALRGQAAAVAHVEDPAMPRAGEDAVREHTLGERGAVPWPAALFLLGIAVLLMSTSALVLSFALSRRAVRVPVEPAPKLPALEAARYV